MQNADPLHKAAPPTDSTGTAEQAIIHLQCDLAPSEALEPIMCIMDDAFDPVFGEAWNEQQVLGMLISPLCQTIIASNNKGDAMGFALSRRVQQEEELLLIAVRPQYRGQSVGKTLLQRVLLSARSANVETVFLEMRADNQAANLYKVFNFKIIGRRLNYYTGMDGRRYDAITYGLLLNTVQINSVFSKQ